MVVSTQFKITCLKDLQGALIFGYGNEILGNYDNDDDDGKWEDDKKWIKTLTSHNREWQRHERS
jgi:hypothetical protein